MTVNGTYPPKHLHSDYDLALTEAKRLQSKYKSKTFVLELKAIVTEELVPVTEVKQVVYSTGDGLPF